jgi:hypothetical protein
MVAANAPRVAPRYREDEKMPREALQLRLTVVAIVLSTNSTTSSPAAVILWSKID